VGITGDRHSLTIAAGTIQNALRDTELTLGHPDLGDELVDVVRAGAGAEVRAPHRGRGQIIHHLFEGVRQSLIWGGKGGTQGVGRHRDIPAGLMHGGEIAVLRRLTKIRERLPEVRVRLVV
jgi:hypothetical protein